MRRVSSYILMLLVFSLNIVSLPALAIKNWQTNLILKVGINGINYNNSVPIEGLSNAIEFNKYGFGSTFQIGFNTRKTRISEFRHYIEFNHIRFDADIEHLGSFRSNKLFLSFSPYQYFIKLNPNGANIFALEAGFTVGYNLYAKYNYKLLDENRKSTVLTDETNIAGINLGLNYARMQFNKEVEMGLKLRISPFLGYVIVEHNYFATEFFYGIKF
jgi:hypothetical protein